MAAPSRGGGQNDGWNDPPMFQYKAASSASPAARTHLNKRVSFPLFSNPAPSSPHAEGSSGTGVLLSPKDGPPRLPPVQILPPTTSTSVHPPVPVLVPCMSPPIDPSALPPSFASAGRDPQLSETLPELLQRLELDSADSLRKYTKKVLHETLDALQDTIQGRSREDVQTRLGLLDDQWRDGKLSEPAKVKLGCLATAVKKEDLKKADSLHLALMVDHITEVSQWMVGVKRIINDLKLSRARRPPVAVPQPGATEAVGTADAKEGSEAGSADVCLNTEKFSGLEPVLMPEMLVPESQGSSTFELQQGTSAEPSTGES
ncbi:steroid receptor RNA activator 1 [Aplysia californica]|uniref:Steroid receptor RNA activator 1 n=1 Tax=Aplysia californica TaxID=6500 RepID=A0ABM0JMZ5_APLCA|nr:steroid receptor RNA activator 1 [Aplysia californica]